MQLWYAKVVFWSIFSRSKEVTKSGSVKVWLRKRRKHFSQCMLYFSCSLALKLAVSHPVYRSWNALCLYNILNFLSTMTTMKMNLRKNKFLILIAWRKAKGVLKKLTGMNYFRWRVFQWWNENLQNCFRWIQCNSDITWISSHMALFLNNWWSY